jgi:hypothetical protein
MNWKNLNNWENLCDDLIKQLPEKAGAYVVRWAPKGKPQIIRRVFEQDESGVLCFGMTGEGNGLQNRLRYFYRAAKGKNYAHAEGQRYSLLNYAQRFPPEELQIGYIVCNNGYKAWETEQDWFNEYESCFGELPPLNYGRGKRQ